jgi:hypothetical protein
MLARVLHDRAGQPGQGERRKSATDVRLDGDEMPADADDGDARDATTSYISMDGAYPPSAARGFSTA